MPVQFWQIRQEARLIGAEVYCDIWEREEKINCLYDIYVWKQNRNFIGLIRDIIGNIWYDVLIYF